MYTLALLAVGVMSLPHLSRLNALPWEAHSRDFLVLNPAFNKRREEDYELLARMLLPAAANGRLVAIPEIGAFGYIYPGKLFDTSGLISPAVLKYFPIPADIPVEIISVPRQMIFDLKPDLFISFDSFMQVTLPPDDPEFLAEYTPSIGMVSHAAFGIQRLMTYRRADLPNEAALPPEANAGGLCATRWPAKPGRLQPARLGRSPKTASWKSRCSGTPARRPSSANCWRE